MEKVYKFEDIELINVKEKMDEYRKELRWGPSHFLPKTVKDVQKFVGLEDDDESFKALDESVNVEKLCSHDSYQIENHSSTLPRYARSLAFEVPEEALYLNTFFRLLQCETKNERSLFGDSMSTSRFVDPPQPKGKPDLRPYEDTVLSIRFYHPFGFIPGYRGNGPYFSKAFLVLGSQKLSELRDQIQCSQDLAPKYDISEDLDQEIKPSATNPGFFFITDTFYNDTRNPLNPDYSDVIIRWAKERPNVFKEPFKKRTMEDVTFEELNIRLGVPQCYLHQGNCEHLFTFSSVELLSPEHILHRQCYPILQHLTLRSVDTCNICGTREHSYVVTNSKKHLNDFTFLCRKCLESFHYVDGEKIDDCKVYKLSQDEMVDVIPVEDG